MHFNIYIEDELAKKIDAIAKVSGKKRNAIIREAIAEWVAKNNNDKWPEEILNFKGYPDYIAPEEHRDDLIPPSDEGIF